MCNFPQDFLIFLILHFLISHVILELLLSREINETSLRQINYAFSSSYHSPIELNLQMIDKSMYENCHFGGPDLLLLNAELFI